ncbi:MAG: hypothetical protein J6R57_04785 [Bacteroidales bacterium]|nr:hypothetical protein [Bacteroidales bacterium]
MKNIEWKKILKYALPILAFVVIAYGYAPQVLEGKIVNQSDISSWEGMANEIVTFNKANPGERTLWTNSMFGGMPATSISVIYDGDFTQWLYDLFFTGARPASYLLISLVGGFLLMLAFGCNVYLAFLGAIAISFCSYNMQIIQVGHNSKMVAIAFMPWVLGAVVYAYRKCAFWGAVLFAFALSFQIKANHPQITYYLAIIILGYGIWQLCKAVKEKAFPKFLRTSIIVLVAGLLGIATNINHLWPTYEYAQHTMRGGSELLPDDSSSDAAQQVEAGKKTRSGLDLEYATQWSYGIEETMNLMVPNFNGGASAGELTRKSETYNALKKGGYQGAEQIIKQLPLYWGPQPFTAGPMYMGAISVFLFVLGFFVLRGGIRWWIGGVSLLALMLGWGYHLMPVSEFFFNWAPMYNKFRTVSMILVILQVLIPVLGVLAANEILFGEDYEGKKERVKKGMYWALGLTAGVCALFAVLPSLAGSFISSSDGQLPGEIAVALANDRAAMLSSDAWRSVFFIVAAFAVIFLAYRRIWVKPVTAAIILAALVLVDLWSVDKRYLNDSHFVTRKEFSNAFAKRAVDEMILQDQDPHYRVLDLSVNTFNDAYVSYHHKTIGGYSPAKLQRYQDLIERNISTEIRVLGQQFGNIQTIEDAQNAMVYLPVLSMLNTKYIILGASVPPVENTFRLGNAWFVNEIVPVNNANEEIETLKVVNPAFQAVVSADFIQQNDALAEEVQRLAAQVNGDNSLGTDASEAEGAVADMSLNNFIELASYAPNKLVYNYSSNKPQITLFSEVYYNPGWVATITPTAGGEAKPLDIFRANWILRGAVVPAGDYTIEFTFNPPCFEKGEVYSMISSGILFLLLLGGLGAMFIRRKK